MAWFLFSLFACQSSLHWTEVANDPAAAFTGVAGTSDSDVWVVGARDGNKGRMLHWNGDSWTTVEPQWPVDLWWVHAIEPDHAFAAGAGCSIFEIDGENVTRHHTPGHAAQTVYGLWGDSPDALFAVGGHAGRDGFIWRWNGRSWNNELLPSLPLMQLGDAPPMFKVWGRDAMDVWVVGGAGTILHFDGFTWRRIPSGTTESLYAVTGFGDEVVVVGGTSHALVLSGDMDGFRDISPEGAVSLQGATFDDKGTLWVAGEPGSAWVGSKANVWRRERGQSFVPVEGASTRQAVHSLWASPEGTVWTAGGNVLDPALDAGFVARGAAAESWVPAWEPIDATEETSPASCPENAIDPQPDASMARRWNEMALNAIRRDTPSPTVHARNLFHLAAATYDAWATFDPVAIGYIVRDKWLDKGEDTLEVRDTAIAYASYRLLQHRYAHARGADVSLACADALMAKLSLDPQNSETELDDGASLGNRIAAAYLDEFMADGANEAVNYADPAVWTPSNPPLYVDRPGARLYQRDEWQPLNLVEAETQNGLIAEAGTQKYIGSHWGSVQGFALPAMDEAGIHHEVGPPPRFDEPAMNEWLVEVIRAQAQLDPAVSASIDISPGRFGNNSLGRNNGRGHPRNPITGTPYAPQVVSIGDFGRVLAEYWSDGPNSETPPGHWNVLANLASDALGDSALQPWQGPLVDRLTWDTQLYFALNGALHDSAIAAWAIKRAHTRIRPISLIRYKAGLGQRSEPSRDDYHPDGLPLISGLIERITSQSAAPGQRHARLRSYIGQVAIRGWSGEPGDRVNEVGGVAWRRGVEWMPYQRRTFVTPAFPGFISGHSTFSRAGAEVLTSFTGSPYFPGGLREFVASPYSYLLFEDGPSMPVRLQWATYYDAADQAGQSRIWGGIHIAPDDVGGRQLGHLVGLDADSEARRWISGRALP